MATVNLGPGDTLNLVVGKTHMVMGRPCQVVAPFLYEDLLEILTPKTSNRPYHRSLGGRLSKRINLFCMALEKGIWTTGAPIKRADIAIKLTDLLNGWLEGEGDVKLTSKAVKALNALEGYSEFLDQNLAAAIKLSLTKCLPESW